MAITPLIPVESMKPVLDSACNFKYLNFVVEVVLVLRNFNCLVYVSTVHALNVFQIFIKFLIENENCNEFYNGHS